MVHTLLENALREHARIQVQTGKTKVWNRAGMRPKACDFLRRPSWWWSMPECGERRRSSCRTGGSRFWDAGRAPIFRQEPVAARSGTPTDVVGPDTSDSTRAVAMDSLAPLRSSPGNFIRVVLPELSDEFATYDKALWMCLSRVLDMPPDACARSARDAASLPLAFGGMGLRSTVRTAVPAYCPVGGTH